MFYKNNDRSAVRSNCYVLLAKQKYPVHTLSVSVPIQKILRCVSRLRVVLSMQRTRNCVKHVLVQQPIFLQLRFITYTSQAMYISCIRKRRGDKKTQKKLSGGALTFAIIKIHLLLLQKRLYVITVSFQECNLKHVFKNDATRHNMINVIRR